MYKQLLPSIMLLLLSTQIQAIDLNNTTEIINQASEATEGLQNEINSAIIELPTAVESPIIETTTPLIVSETAIYTEEVVVLIEEEPVFISEENSSINQTTVILETSIPSIEENQTITEELIVIQEPETTVETTDMIIIEIENNTTLAAVAPSPIETNISSQENNNTLNKETFDMSTGDADKGKKIFIHNFKDLCKTKGSKFAANHSQDEWEELAEEGKFEKKIFELCPKVESSYQKKWSADLYQFYYENANDSEHIPEC